MNKLTDTILPFSDLIWSTALTQLLGYWDWCYKFLYHFTLPTNSLVCQMFFPQILIHYFFWLYKPPIRVNSTAFINKTYPHQPLISSCSQSDQHQTLKQAIFSFWSILCSHKSSKTLICFIPTIVFSDYILIHKAILFPIDE